MSLSGRLPGRNRGWAPYRPRHGCGRVSGPDGPSWADGEHLLPRCGSGRIAGQPCGSRRGRPSGRGDRSRPRARAREPPLTHSLLPPSGSGDHSGSASATTRRRDGRRGEGSGSIGRVSSRDGTGSPGCSRARSAAHTAACVRSCSCRCSYARCRQLRRQYSRGRPCAGRRNCRPHHSHHACRWSWSSVSLTGATYRHVTKAGGAAILVARHSGR